MIDTTSIVTFPGSYWLGEFRGDLGQLKRLIPQHCQIEAALRFMRIPYWVVSGAETTMGDLRYDYGRGSGFATVVSREGETCDVIVPPWDPPFGVFSETSP